MKQGGRVRHHALAIFLIFLGGGLGSVLRHSVNQTSAAIFGIDYPWGTLMVNVIGALAMGLLVGWFTFRSEGGQLLRLFLATGILGGFTTFSAFSLDIVLLWERGDAAGAVLYAGGSVAAAIAGVFSGIAIMRALLS
jgi:CrcB protein